MRTIDFILLAALGAIGYLVWKNSTGRTEAPLLQVKQESRMEFGGGGGGSMPFGNFFS